MTSETRFVPLGKPPAAPPPLPTTSSLPRSPVTSAQLVFTSSSLESMLLGHTHSQLLTIPSSPPPAHRVVAVEIASDEPDLAKQSSSVLIPSPSILSIPLTPPLLPSPTAHSIPTPTQKNQLGCGSLESPPSFATVAAKPSLAPLVTGKTTLGGIACVHSTQFFNPDKRDRWMRRRCWRCGELGHRAAICRNARVCFACGVLGHSSAQCVFRKNQINTLLHPTAAMSEKIPTPSLRHFPPPNPKPPPKPPSRPHPPPNPSPLQPNPPLNPSPSLLNPYPNLPHPQPLPKPPSLPNLHPHQPRPNLNTMMTSNLPS